MMSVETLLASSKSAPAGKLLLPITDEDNTEELSFEELLLSLSHSTKTSKASQTLLSSIVGQKEEVNNEEATTLQELQALLQNDKETLPNPKSNVSTLHQLPETLHKMPEKESFGVDKKISSTLTLNELKHLLAKAKHFIAHKITKLSHAQNDEDTKSMPKTLKGVLQKAQKLGIEVKKITYETLNEEGIKENPVHQEVEKRVMKKMQPLKDIPLFTQRNLAAVSTKEFIETKTSTKHSLKAKPKEQKKLHGNSQLLEGLLRSIEKEKPAETLQTQLAQNKTPTLKNRENSLEMRLDEHKQTNKQNSMQNLEQLLHAEESTQHSSTHIKSSDSFDVKIHEAKQMMRYLGEDIKKAIDEYKPPFSRVSLKLNPRHLGELAMTVVQRGKKVHVNLSSNNAAINLLANNLQELKVHLNQNGIHNASFSFNANTSDGNNQKERQKEERSRAYEINHEEETEESLHSLEITIPRYI